MSSIGRYARQIPSLQLSMLGVPLHHGQPKVGVRQGPSAIRSAGLGNRLENLGWTVEDHGNILVEPSKDIGNKHYKHLASISDVCSRTSDHVYTARSEGKFALTLGGDHSIGLGSVAGNLRASDQLGVIWVDAHADINTPETTLSGNVHGMPVSFLMDVHNIRSLPGMEWMTNVPLLAPSRLVYIGLRDLDIGEKKLIKDMNVLAFTMRDIDKHGIGKVMEMTMDHLCGRKSRPLHLSFDIDACDPENAPATGTTARGGLTYRDAFYLAESASESGYLTGMDMVEVNPTLETADSSVHSTAEYASRLIVAALGDQIL
jgi:arginase